ncbi:MAG: electron transfer flavoprotein subunit alpha/FixB family protein [Calditrichia bacterium]
MADNILVVFEIRSHKIKKVSYEAAAAARRIASESGGDVAALLVGSDIENLASQAGKYGISKAFVVDQPELEKFSPDVFASIIAQAAEQTDSRYILMGATAMGKDVMPRAAFRLNSALAQDVIGIDTAGGQPGFLRPMLAGKLQATISLKSEYRLITVRPNTFPAEENETDTQVEALSVEIPQPRAVVEEELVESGGKLDVAEAEIIVSGGRGMKGPENWHLIEELAGSLNAATGASRAVVDAGWRDHAEQVGQTGKTVSPNLYVACGISGAIQHQAGMSTSKTIVAINKDPDAPIFKIADYGILGDVFEVLPKLTEEIKKVKAE